LDRQTNELRKQQSEVESQIRSVELAEKQALFDELVRGPGIDTLLLFVSHIPGCGDGIVRGDKPGCKRCYLLRAKEQQYLSTDATITLEIQVEDW
jgi:hypothetical protein